jgi:GAF domain-containing protein
VNRNTILKSTLLGVAFGLIFPLISIYWITRQNQLQIIPVSLIQVHKLNSLLWVIDTAPLFLGLFAFFTGKKQAEGIALNEKLDLILAEKESLIGELAVSKQGLSRDINKRLLELTTIAQVAREAASIHNLDELLFQTTRLISNYFGFYHIGIFLIDDIGENVILKATNSKGGQRLLEENHGLKVGQLGIVGHVAANGNPMIASEVDRDAVYFNNPYLRETKSEMALPLKIRENLIGVLDVQADIVDAFTSDDLEIFQILTDQIALAIDNARLFNQHKQTIQELEQLYSQQVHHTWQKQLNSKKLGYQYDLFEIVPIKSQDVVEQDNPKKDFSIQLPLNLREQSIGHIHLQRNDQNALPWSKNEIEVIKKVSDQIALSIENARLLEESNRLATREQKINLISNQIRSSVDLETILQTSVRELGQALDSTQTIIQIGLEEKRGAGDFSP